MFTLNDYNGVSRENKYPWKCVKCNNEFKDHIDNEHPRCLNCYPILIGFSKMEKEVAEFCKIYYPNLIENDRTILNPLELDIYIPEINLAIEFNGLYWHSELNGKDKTYHLNKYLDCKNKGIKLVQIFEDEWVNKEKIVKSMLLNKMGKITKRIHARKCEIGELSNKNSRKFLEENHIQGYVTSKYNIGLFYDFELVALLSIGISRYNKNYDYEITRFCSKLNTNIPGAFSKALKYFTDRYKSSSIITYADLRYGDGNVYIKNGFKLIEKSNPNYFYITENLTRDSRVKFQKHKLEEKLQTSNPKLTEWENMKLNGHDRIWDVGNNVFEYRRT